MIIDKDDFYVTSDLHFGHKLVAQDIRGFATTQEHDDVVEENIMSCVPKGSLFIILGDLSVHQDEYALEILQRIKEKLDLTLVLTPGNHDMIHSMFGLEKNLQYAKMYRDVFDLIVPEVKSSYKSRSAVFTHYHAYESEHTQTFNHLRAQPDPKLWDFIIHGHNHGGEQIGYRQVNVALEHTALQPVSSQQLTDLLEQSKSIQ